MTEATTEVKKVVKKPQRTGDFAVIQTGGKQYLVFVGDEVKIEKFAEESKIGDKVTFDKVLLKDSGEETKIGTPFLSGAKVEAEVIEIGKLPKVEVVKYKAKTRYFKKIGHKQPFVKIKITSL